MTWENRLTFEVSSAGPDETPVWVDISLFILDHVQATEWSGGRQTSLTQSDPGQLTVLLNNADDRFTVGNTLSPYSSWPWGEGLKVRLRERIGNLTFDQFTGYILQITETVVEEGVDQQVQLVCGDWLARLERAPVFSSALGEYILATPDLVGYWPLTNPGSPLAGLGPVVSPMTVSSFLGTSFIDDQSGQVLFGQGLAPVGGEAGGLRLTTRKDDSGNVLDGPQLNWPLTFEPSINSAGGDNLAVVMWLASTGTTYGTQTIAGLFVMGGGDETLNLVRSPSTNAWTLTGSGSMAGTIAIGTVGSALLPIGIWFSGSTSTLELWIGGQRFSTTLTGSAPTAAVLFQGLFAVGLDDDVSHMQVYIGRSYSYTNFLAQITMGYTPLERQTTGQRVSTILDYAGVPAGTRRIDTGTSAMQMASLAGKSPLEALREAERTEQGLLYVDGSGNVVFADRRRLYNI